MTQKGQPSGALEAVQASDMAGFLAKEADMMRKLGDATLPIEAVLPVLGRLTAITLFSALPDPTDEARVSGRMVEVINCATDLLDDMTAAVIAMAAEGEV